MADTALAHRVTLSESAAQRVQTLIGMEGNADMMLRVGVMGGGCSGFQYTIALDDQVNGDDVVIDQHGVRMVVDETSLDLLAGSEVDFVEDMIGSSFQIKNPNATSTCGCGSSFSM